MKITVESIQDHIPFYLTQEDREDLVKELNVFPKNNYYISGYNNKVLQGDGWTSLEMFNFESGERESVSGIIISNSCDIAPDNKRTFSPKINFALLINLDKYANLLKQRGLDNRVIENKLAAIKNQHVSNIFYLPKQNKLELDYIAMLNEIYTISLESFLKKASRCKIFTLSQIGFYLFILKLSVHFCRFQENLDRKEETL